MRLSPLALSFAYIFAACQSTGRGTPADLPATVPAANATEVASATPVAVEQPSPEAAPADFAPAAEGDGTDCTLDVALSCTDTEVDGCLTGQASVHRCVSLNPP